MKDYILMLIVVSLIGCTYVSSTSMRAKGKNVKTPYGKGDIDYVINRTMNMSFWK